MGGWVVGALRKLDSAGEFARGNRVRSQIIAFHTQSGGKTMASNTKASDLFCARRSTRPRR